MFMILSKPTTTATKSIGVKTTKTVATKTPTMVATGKRYQLVNKNSGKARRFAATRAMARDLKKANERIWDVTKSAFVR